ncbi:MAG TPA: PRC-barrel domain-containing protein [Streptosporangiaceae bacterium]|nr:PRC-barrel domain-containing protein [Streptosporangiaceae bacterium]
MRASELIGCQVYDAAGQDVGTVHDLHFRMQQRPDGSRVCQLDALECGGIGFGHRLGYGEHAMRGPWPFPQLFRHLTRRSLAIPWTEIDVIDGRRIDISSRRDQIEPARKPLT